MSKSRVETSPEERKPTVYRTQPKKLTITNIFHTHSLEVALED